MSQHVFNFSAVFIFGTSDLVQDVFCGLSIVLYLVDHAKDSAFI